MKAKCSFMRASVGLPDCQIAQFGPTVRIVAGRFGCPRPEIRNSRSARLGQSAVFGRSVGPSGL
eukprot:5519094-Alexandrium_andersonii.AAC.1